MYRIAWKSLITGRTFAGEYCLSEEEAQEEADRLNEKYADHLTHWIEKEQ